MIVWVFGYTAVGKKTFLFESSNPDKYAGIRNILKIDPERTILPVVIPNLAGDYSDDYYLKSANNRREILKSILGTRFPESVIIAIHGQGVDITRNILLQMYSLYPEQFMDSIMIGIWPDPQTFNQFRNKRDLKKEDISGAINWTKNNLSKIQHLFHQTIHINHEHINQHHNL